MQVFQLIEPCILNILCEEFNMHSVVVYDVIDCNDISYNEITKLNDEQRKV